MGEAVEGPPASDLMSRSLRSLSKKPSVEEEEAADDDCGGWPVAQW